MKFSVIVPVYNVAPYLRECLDSVLSQTVQDWECVCVDDGSTDGSSKILDAYGEKDPRFKIIHKGNGGVASARNAALDVIQGEWYLFLDSDDVWAPNLLEICLRGMAFEGGAEIVQFQDRHFPQDSKCSWNGCNNDSAFSLVEMDGPFSRTWIGFVAPKKAFRRETFMDLREKPYVVGEDLLYLTQCALRAHKMVCTPLRLYGYRMRNTSVTHSVVTERVAIDSISFYSDIMELLASSKRQVCPAMARWLANTICEIYVFDKWSILWRCKTVLNKWLSVVKEGSAINYFSRFQRYRMLVVGSVHTRPLVWGLCWLPCWLKRKGLHR